MDAAFIQLIVVLIFVLGVLGARSTWALIKKFAEFLGMGIDSIEGLVLSVILFIAAFCTISPVMGVIAIIKKLSGN